MKKLRHNEKLRPHPMDEILVRRLRFKFDKSEDFNPIWSKTNPEFSIFLNALGIHIPHFEKFLVKVMNRNLDKINNKMLEDDINNIVGQESLHASNFFKWTKAMSKRYPKLEKLDKNAKKYFDRSLREKNEKFNIGFTAGYETFTFLGGMIILKNYNKYMKKADPTLRAFWVWHQVEEVEHGSVAFDFFKYFYPKNELYRKSMVIFTYSHIVLETFKAYSHMIKMEGYYSSLSKAIKAWKFFFTFGFELGYTALPVLRKNYHPRNHPICHEKQSEIAISWRKYYSEGNNPHKLTEKHMAVLLNENS
jgi:hypothetical protein